MHAQPTAGKSILLYQNRKKANMFVENTKEGKSI
jgi:hypothetical protein